MAANFLRPNQVKLEYSISVYTLRKRLRAGDLTAHFFNGLLYVDRAELEDLIRGGRRRTQPEAEAATVVEEEKLSD